MLINNYDDLKLTAFIKLTKSLILLHEQESNFSHHGWMGFGKG